MRTTPLFTTDEITMLLLMCHEKSWEGGIDPVGQEHNAVWENIGNQIKALLSYYTCCGCLALVHREDRESHPCRCECNKPLVVSVGHPHEADHPQPGDAARQEVP